jgi:Holliday junction resolvase RusA-like endonuclease
MPEPVTITVYGTPTPQGSKSGFAIKKDGQYTGRVAMVEGSNKSEAARQRMKDWRADVRQAAAAVMREFQSSVLLDPGFPLDGPLAVTVTLTMPKPKTAPKTKRTWPCKRPDIDKLLRSVFDSLTTSGLFRDDAQIVYLTAAKCYPGETGASATVLDAPGAVITIRAVS